MLRNSYNIKLINQILPEKQREDLKENVTIPEQ